MKQFQRTASELDQPHRIPPPGSELYRYFVAGDPPVGAARYLQAVCKHKWAVLGLLVTCLLSTYFFTSLLTPIYEATARIVIDRSAGPDASERRKSSSLTADADRFLSIQEEVIQSDAVLRPVAQEFKLLDRENQLRKLTPGKAQQKRAAPISLKQLRVRRSAKTDVIRISYRSPDAMLAANVANAIAQSYLGYASGRKNQFSSDVSASMEKELVESKARMERSILALAQVEQQGDALKPEENTSGLANRLQAVSKEFANAKEDRLRKEAAYNALQSGPASPVSNQEDVSSAYERLNQAKQHYVEVSATYSSNHPEYLKAANELADSQHQFDQAKQNAAERIEADYREALKHEQTLRRAVKQARTEYEQGNPRSSEYEQLKRDADNAKSLYSDLRRRIEERKDNTKAGDGTVRIADLARPPDVPVFPNQGLNLLCAFIISSLFAMCGAIWWDVRSSAIRDAEPSTRVGLIRHPKRGAARRPANRR